MFNREYENLNEGRDDPMYHAMILVGQYLSVLTDLPSFVVTSRWFANHADQWWRFYTAKIFDIHPPGVVPLKLERNMTNWRGLFFDKYHWEYDLHYRRRTLLIKDGNIDQLKKEDKNGIVIGKVTWSSFFEPCDIFGGRDYHYRPSLHAVAHTVSAENRTKVLDYFFEVITQAVTLPESQLKILRRFLDIPNLTYWDYISLKHYLINCYSLPIIEALDCKDYEMALIMIKCGADLGERHKLSHYHDSSVLGYVISKVARLIMYGYTIADFGSRMIRDIPYHVGHRPNYDNPAELIAYCKTHYAEMLDQVIANLHHARLKI